ncbi:hypothetical protein BH10BAC2_BH10BAC2_42980 [soil metagenome]
MKKIILTPLSFLMFLISGYTQSWNLTGNAGINPASNFLGTTDAQSIVFRVNNKRSGYIDYDTTKGITSFGYRALFAGTGVDNTAVGYQALFSNTTGNSNTAMGYLALYSNTNGIHNIAIGQRALYSNIGGHSNIAIGYQALTKNSTGITSTAIGAGALSLNTTGYSNVATGFNALYNNVNGFYNTACGNNTLFSNTSGKSNTAMGFSAGSQSNLNTNCTFLGYDADQTGTADFTNSMALGNTARITASNQVRVGNVSVTSIGGQVSWTTISDGRYKKEVKNNVPGLQFINKLKPVTYHLDVSGISNFLQEERKGNEGEERNALADNELKAFVEKGIKEKEKILYTGFIAQEVEKAAKEIGYDFSGVDVPEHEDDYYGLRYGDFVVPLVKAVQELSKMNDDKDAKIDGLQKQIDELKLMMNDVSKTSVSLSKNSLEQNIPNPFNNNSSIRYTIPVSAKNAQLMIIDNSGKTIKQITLNAGAGVITINASTLSSGTYNYSLWVDGKLVESKKMTIAK